MESSYKPIVSEDMYEQVLSWLVEHSLKHNYCTLFTRLCALHPDLLERARFPDKHLLVFHSFLFAVKSRGPLPSLLNPVCVSTLLDGVVKFVMSDNSIFDRFDRVDVARLISALRFILIKVVFHSSKFLKRDVTTLLDQLFPEVGSKEEEAAWERNKQLFRVQDDDNLKEIIRTSANHARTYFKNRLKRVAEENKKDPSGSVLDVWTNIQSTLWSLQPYIWSRAPPSALEALEAGLSPWLDYVRAGAGSLGEEDLGALLEDLVDLRTQSRFWLSFKTPEFGKQTVEAELKNSDLIVQDAL